MFEQQLQKNNLWQLEGHGVSVCFEGKNENLEEKIGPLKTKTHTYFEYILLILTGELKVSYLPKNLILKYNKSFKFDDGKAISKIN